MFGPKQHERAPLRDKTPFLTSSLESNEGLEPRMLLDDRSDESETEGESPGTTDLLIQGLMDRLPQPDSTWSLDCRAKWLQTAASIFGLVYKADDGERREVSIVLAKEDAADLQGFMYVLGLCWTLSKRPPSPPTTLWLTKSSKTKALPSLLEPSGQRLR